MKFNLYVYKKNKILKDTFYPTAIFSSFKFPRDPALGNAINTVKIVAEQALFFTAIDFVLAAILQIQVKLP